jgi:hypothetical protein
VGWDGKLPMEQIGAPLAAATPHHAASGVPSAQRPIAIPLADVPEILLSGQLRSACPDARRAVGHLPPGEQLACDLDAFAPSGTPCFCRNPRRPHPAARAGWQNRPLADSESGERKLNELS